MGVKGAIRWCRRCPSTSWPRLQARDWRAPPFLADKSWQRLRQDWALAEPVPESGRKKNPKRKKPSREAASGRQPSGGTAKQHQQQQGKHQEGLNEGENPSADGEGYITLMSVRGEKGILSPLPISQTQEEKRFTLALVSGSLFWI